MIIRPATNEEYHYIAYLSPKVSHESSMGLVTIPQGKTVKELTGLANSVYFALIDDYVIKGWVLIGETADPYSGERIGMIGELFVLPLFRGKGLGRLLMEHSIAELKARGIKKIQLNVFAGNVAKKLYRQIGFQDVCTLMELKL